MKIQFILLLCLSVILQGYTKDISSRDLTDEAQAQIDNLKSIMQGEILAAHDNLDEIRLNFLFGSQTVALQGQMDIQQEHQTVTDQITVLRTLSEDSGLDAGQCIDVPEQFINRLATELSWGISSCTGVIDLEVTNLVGEAYYIIDIEWTKIESYEFELSRCNNQITCISTILTEVQLDEIRLPKSIQRELGSVRGLIELLDISIGQCYSSGVSQYTSQATTIVENIQECITQLGEGNRGDEGDDGRTIKQ